MRVLIATAVLATACTSFEIAGDPQPVTVMREPNVPIPDDNDVGVTDVAQVTEPCTIDSVRIEIEIVHEFRGDVFADITSPAGTLVFLKSIEDNDGGMDVIGTWPDTLIPVQPLDAFEGEEGMGGWSLRVGDLACEDTGTWLSWTLNLLCF